MCTVVVLRRPDHAWPLILAANRDEMAERPWLPPGRHWPDRPQVTAGLDRMAGGSWLGLNDEGVVAGVLNRRHSLGSDPGLRSRGELVLEALDHADAVEAAAALKDLDAGSYRPFNMVVADNRDAYWLRALGPDGDRRLQVAELPEGLSMITSRDRNDATSPRIRLYLPRFEAASAPDPDADDWAAWEALLAAREHAPDSDPSEAMAVVTDYGFGTLSSSLIALPSIDRFGCRPVWRFAPGRPGEVPHRPIPL